MTPRENPLEVDRRVRRFAVHCEIDMLTATANDRLRRAAVAAETGDSALALLLLQAELAHTQARVLILDLERTEVVRKLWIRMPGLYEQNEDFWARFETAPAKPAAP